MHQSYIPAEALDRVAWMRGGHHKIIVDPARTAHVVVDLQVGFMGEGALLEMPIARGIVENVNRVSRALRSARGTIAYVQYKFDPDEPQHWGSHYGRMTPDAVERMRAAFTVGAEQHALWSGLDVQPEDLIVPKTRWSAFIPGTCDLDSLLKDRGIDTLIVTGTTTNCCCESTMRDAMQMGYYVLFVQDGNATRGDAVHNASLANMLLFGDVVTADEAIARIKAGRHSEAANAPNVESPSQSIIKTNVVGAVHPFNLFLPFILNGQQKKVIAISSGIADLDLISKYEIELSGPYSIGKAATNAVVSKFSTEYAKDGVLFMSISPGVVDTTHFNPAELTEEDLQSVGALAAKFQKYAPHFQGLITAEASVKSIISVYKKASLANGDGGSFVSHLGTKQWL